MKTFKRFLRWLHYRRMSPADRRMAYLLDSYFAEWNQVIDRMEGK